MNPPTAVREGENGEDSSAPEISLNTVRRKRGRWREVRSQRTRKEGGWGGIQEKVESGASRGKRRGKEREDDLRKTERKYTPIAWEICTS